MILKIVCSFLFCLACFSQLGAGNNLAGYEG